MPVLDLPINSIYVQFFLKSRFADFYEYFDISKTPFYLKIEGLEFEKLQVKV